MVCATKDGEHGGGSYGWTFSYSVVDASTGGEPEVVVVPPPPGHQGDSALRPAL
jgi:hypothetical protein